MNGKLLTAPVGFVPAGLLDFYGLKSMGENPQVLGNLIQPTMDLTRWYADSRAQGVFVVTTNPVTAPLAANLAASAVAIQATGPLNLSDGTDVIVPANEVWLVLEANVRWTFSAAAGQSANFQMLHAEQKGNGTQVQWPMTVVGNVASSATTNLAGRSILDHPMLIYGDSSIKIDCNGAIVAAATISVGMGMRLLRLQR